MNYFKEINVAVTVCDKEGKIVDMNDKSRKTFLKPGREELIGKNVLDCHPEPAHSLLADMLQNPRTHVYTIEKNGVKKLIYQTPWYENGEYRGFMELSLEIPEELKHYVRNRRKMEDHGSTSPLFTFSKSLPDRFAGNRGHWLLQKIRPMLSG